MASARTREEIGEEVGYPSSMERVGAGNGTEWMGRGGLQFSLHLFVGWNGFGAGIAPLAGLGAGAADERVAALL